MNDLTMTSSSHQGASPLPAPRIEGAISIRVATLADVPFMDSLQKQHTKQVGYFPTKQFEGYIAMGGVLIAEQGSGFGVQGSGNADAAPNALPRSSLNPEPRTLNPLGYIISRDRYLKRDELGVVYQLCVAEGNKRKLIGATLLKAVFERSAYGCKLYCCWCAQDIAANRFWESMGFVPVAFRAGSTGKQRVHIFWQKRINADDFETKYWYPCQTNAGAIREDRLVFPIPPGTHWSEVQAVALPTEKLPVASKQLAVKGDKKRSALATGNSQLATSSAPTMETRGLRFAPIAPVSEVSIPKPPRPARVKVKVDPKLVSAARELRDRWMERVNEDPSVLESNGKYVIHRLSEPARRATTQLLTAA